MSTPPLSTTQREHSPLLAFRQGLISLDAALTKILQQHPLKSLGQKVEQRGYFTPAEDDQLRQWFVRFLNLRHHLFEYIEEMKARMPALPQRPDSSDWPSFLMGYSAACLIALADRSLVEACTDRTLLQRKLNEPAPRFRLPAKQYTQVRRSWTLPRHAWNMLMTMRHANQHRETLTALQQDTQWHVIAKRLPELEQALLANFNTFTKAYYRYQRHNIRRRGARLQQKTIFSVLTISGRWLSKKNPKIRPKRVKPAIQKAILELLRPGDVVVTRHDLAMTNLFLPGFWPHAALFVGSPPQATALRDEMHPNRRENWRKDTPFLEALKDGVRFRPAATTLAVDALVILRPQLSDGAIAEGIARAITHEGKPYNFDFDFFRSDRLVCTEVIYRAYDGLEQLECRLQQRSGRPTFSAEDLLDMAIEDRGFKPVALYGTKGARSTLLTGPHLRNAIAATYRENSLL